MESENPNEGESPPEAQLPPSNRVFHGSEPDNRYHMYMDMRETYDQSYESQNTTVGDISVPQLFSTSSPSTSLPLLLSSPHAHILYSSPHSHIDSSDSFSYTPENQPSIDRSSLAFSSSQSHLSSLRTEQSYGSSYITGYHPPGKAPAYPPGASTLNPPQSAPSFHLPLQWHHQSLKSIHSSRNAASEAYSEPHSPVSPQSSRFRKTTSSSASNSPRPKGTSARTDPSLSPQLSPKISPTVREKIDSPHSSNSSLLWVNNLPFQWQDNDIEIELQALLDANSKGSEKLQILSVQRLNDASTERAHRGLAVIALTSKKEADDAMQILRHCKVQGKFLSLSFHAPMESAEEEDAAVSSTNTIFVANVHPSVTEDQIKLLFMQFGDVVNTVVVRNRHSSQSRGFVFVEYAEHASCELALRYLQNETFCGQQLKLKLAKTPISSMTSTSRGGLSSAISQSSIAHASFNQASISSTTPPPTAVPPLAPSKSSTAPIPSALSPPSSSLPSPRTKRSSKSNTDLEPSRPTRTKGSKRGAVAISSPRMSPSPASSLSPRSISSLASTADTSTSLQNSSYPRRYSTSSLPRYTANHPPHSAPNSKADAYASEEMQDTHNEQL